MKWIQNIIVFSIASIIISFFILIFYNMVKSDKKLFEDRRNRAEILVGERVIIGADTLTIMKYDVAEDTYQLSNYQYATYTVVSKNVIKR
jgi:hypothetical protein